MASQPANSRSYLGKAVDYAYDALPRTAVGQTSEAATHTLKKVSDVSEKLVGLLENPRNLTKEMVLGFYDALSELSPVERSFSAATSVISKTALSTLLHHGTFIGNPEDENETQEREFEAIKDRFDKLGEAEDRNAELKQIRAKVQEMHVLFGNFQLNPQPSSDNNLRTFRTPESGEGGAKKQDKADGTSPIDLVADVQEQIRMLADQHGFEPLSPSSGVIPDDPDTAPSENVVAPRASEESIEEMRGKTQEILDRFSTRVINYATMYAVASIFRENVEPSKLNELLSKGGNLEVEYLKQYRASRLSYYLHRLLFRAVRFLIAPLVTDTLTGVLDRLRSFVTNEEELRAFTQGKIEALSEYYTRVDDARTEFLSGKKPKEISRFAAFLKATILIYDGEYNEEDLLRHVGTYIVDHFVTRPQFKIRIPLLTPIAEKIVFATRKKMVKSVLEKTGIIKTLFAKGEESIPNAELGIKLMLEKKLLEIRKMLERSRFKRVEKIDIASESKRVDIATLKAAKIPQDLHLAIQEHSEGLLTFGRIVACKGSKKKLSQIDNRVQRAFEEASELLPFTPPSLEELLKQSTTEITETALLSIFDNTDKQLETQAETLLEILDKSFDFTPDKERAANDKKLRLELERVDRRLSTLVEEISRIGVQATLDNYLGNVPAERHQKILTYVEKEKQLLRDAFEQIEAKKREIQSLSRKKMKWNPDAPFSRQLKEQLAEATGLLVFYLDHISLELRSAEHEELCYADVRGDLNNLYATAARYLQQDLDDLSAIAAIIPDLEAAEQELLQAQNYRESLEENANLLSMKLEQALPTLIQLREQLPNSLQGSFNLERLNEPWDQRDRAQEALEIFSTYTLLDQEIADLGAQLDVYKEVNAQTNKLEHYLNIWKTKPSEETVRLIKKQVALIKSHPETTIQEQIAPLLSTRDLNALYQSFHPGLIHRSKIREKLSQLNSGAKTEQRAKMRERNHFKIPKETTFEGLHQTFTQSEEAIAQQFSTFTQTLDAHITTKAAFIQVQKKSLKKSFTSPSKNLPVREKFLTSVENLNVKGCLTVGDTGLFELFGKPLTGKVIPTIVKGSRNLIHAMGDPFHYKQLALRLVAVDLANSNTAKAKKK